MSCFRESQEQCSTLLASTRTKWERELDVTGLQRVAQHAPHGMLTVQYAATQDTLTSFEPLRVMNGSNPLFLEYNAVDKLITHFVEATDF